MCECSRFVVNDAASTLRPTARDPARSILDPTRTNDTPAFQNKWTFSKRDFSVHDEIPHSENAKVVDTDKHSFDHLQNISYRHAREPPELEPRLRQSVLLIKDKKATNATYDDAAELAKYDCKFPPHTDGYDTFMKACMQ